MEGLGPALLSPSQGAVLLPHPRAPHLSVPT